MNVRTECSVVATDPDHGAGIRVLAIFDTTSSQFLHPTLFIAIVLGPQMLP